MNIQSTSYPPYHTGPRTAPRTRSTYYPEGYVEGTRKQVTEAFNSTFQHIHNGLKQAN